MELIVAPPVRRFRLVTLAMKLVWLLLAFKVALSKFTVDVPLPPVMFFKVQSAPLGRLAVPVAPVIMPVQYMLVV